MRWFSLQIMGWLRAQLPDQPEMPAIDDAGRCGHPTAGPVTALRGAERLGSPPPRSSGTAGIRYSRETVRHR